MSIANVKLAKDIQQPNLFFLKFCKLLESKLGDQFVN